MGLQVKKLYPTLFMLIIFMGIVVTEWVFVYENVGYGIMLALFMVLAIYTVVSVTRQNRDFSDSVESLALLPLYILFTSSLPWFFIDQQFLIPAVYSLIIAICGWYIYEKDISLTEIGFKKEYLLGYILLGACIGIPTGTVEYLILLPAPAFPVFEFKYLFRDLIYMTFFVALGEEVLFRGLVQRNLTKTYGWKIGLLSAGFLFSVMHLTWRSVPELGFTFFAGILFGYIYYKTESLVAPIVLHGVNNVMLVAIMPYVFS